MELLITIVHVATCLILILTVLLQSGKGGGMGAALGGGGGAGSQIFGGRGASTFLTRITSGAAIVFFLTSITLAGLGSRKESTGERLLREKQQETNTLSGDADAPAEAPVEESPTDDANAETAETADGDAATPASEQGSSEPTPAEEPATPAPQGGDEGSPTEAPDSTDAP